MTGVALSTLRGGFFENPGRRFLSVWQSCGNVWHLRVTKPCRADVTALGAMASGAQNGKEITYGNSGRNPKIAVNPQV